MLKADVHASDVVFWDDSRREQEVLLRRDISAGVDPEPETWAETASKVIERIGAREKAQLEGMKSESPPSQITRRSRRASFLPFEDQIGKHGRYHHQDERHGIAVRPFQLQNVFEVHAVDRGDQRRRH